MEGIYMKKILLTMIFSLSLFFGQNAVSGFDLTEGAVQDLDVIDVIEGGEYIDDLTITIPGTATLNGEVYESGTIINEIGYHELVLYELGVEIDTIHFTILPRFTTQMDNRIVTDSLDIQLENVGIIAINHQTVENNSTYRYAGEHILTVHGLKGYQMSYSVRVLDSKIEYLKENEMYTDFVIDISKYLEVYYEDELVEENLSFTEIGHYSITVLYSNRLEETIEFTYGHMTNRFVNGGVYPNSLLMQKDSAERWYVDNSEQKNGLNSLVLTVVGKHTITFYGKNDYTKAYTVTISEGDIGIEDGMVFDHYFQMEYSGFNVALNGVNYKSDYKKSGGGNYVLKVKGTYGYENYYNIFIKETVPFEKRSSLDPIQNFNESITLDQDFNKIYVNGKEVENYRFSESGEYRIVYLGAGGYIDAYTISYTNYHENVNKALFGAVIGITSLVGVTYIFLAWRKFK